MADEDIGGEIAETSEQGFHTSQPRARLYASHALFGGDTTTLELRVRTAWGTPITSFEDEHTKKVHLVIVSHDLSYFAHVHPTYAGGGRFKIDWTPPNVEDDYTIYAQYRPTGSPSLITSRFKAHVPALTMKAPVPVIEATAPSRRGAAS